MLHIFLGYEYTFSDDFHLHLTIRGIERIHQHVPRRAKPITPAILLAVQKLSTSFNSLQHTVFACALFLFFSMARAGSILPASRSTPTHQYLTRDRVNTFNKGILITLIHTKTIQFGRRRLHIPLLTSPSPLCPVAAFLYSSSLLPCHQATPAFVYTHAGSIKWLTQSIFIRVFRQLISRAGIPDASGFTGHSFRRGGGFVGFPGRHAGGAHPDVWGLVQRCLQELSRIFHAEQSYSCCPTHERPSLLVPQPVFGGLAM